MRRVAGRQKAEATIAISCATTGSAFLRNGCVMARKIATRVRMNLAVKALPKAAKPRGAAKSVSPTAFQEIV